MATEIDLAVIRRFVDVALGGTTQYFHDTGDNGDINDPSAPLAHATLFAQYVNRLYSEGR